MGAEDLPDCGGPGLGLPDVLGAAFFFLDAGDVPAALGAAAVVGLGLGVDT